MLQGLVVDCISVKESQSIKQLFDFPHKMVCCSMAGLAVSRLQCARAVHGCKLPCCKKKAGIVTCCRCERGAQE